MKNVSRSTMIYIVLPLVLYVLHLLGEAWSDGKMTFPEILHVIELGVMYYVGLFTKREAAVTGDIE